MTDPAELRRTLKQHEPAEILSLWKDGLASGPGRLGDIGEIKREARRRLEIKAPKTDV